MDAPYWSVVVVAALGGMLFGASLPVVLELAAEVTYPMTPVVGGLVFTAASSVGFAASAAVVLLAPGPDAFVVTVLATATIFLLGLAVVVCRLPYNRQRHDTQFDFDNNNNNNSNSGSVDSNTLDHPPPL